jgi:hypothetical protein
VGLLLVRSFWSEKTNLTTLAEDLQYYSQGWNGQDLAEKN